MTPVAIRWLLDTALAAGLVLLAGSVLIALVCQPARRQRLGEWTLIACLLVAAIQCLPNLPRVSLGLLPAAPTGKAQLAERDTGGMEAFSTHDLTVGSHSTVKPAAAGAPGSARHAIAGWGIRARAVADTAVGGVSDTAMAAACVRLVAGHLHLRRLVRSAPGPDAEMAALWSDLTGTLRRPAALRVTTRIARPICFGVFHPIVLVPQHLTVPERRDDLRVILLHELVHIRRRDAATWLLASLTGVLFFYQPLLWHLQRQLRLAQEYIADAWAAEEAQSPVAYAENLLRLLREDIHPIPVTASAAVRGPSEFYRRMQRLLTSEAPTEKGCSPRWTLAAGVLVLALALVCSAVTVQAARNRQAAPMAAPSSVMAFDAASSQGRGINFLLTRQGSDGGWLSEFGPAPTALVLRALLQQGVPVEALAVSRALACLETFHQPDHGYYRDSEPTYNTAIVLSTLALVPGERYNRVLAEGQHFLEIRRGIDAQRPRGGWYGPSQTLTSADARPAPRWLDPSERSAEAILDTYGSLTYAGLKSLVYAGLSKDDARVRRSIEWLRGNWTLEKNPGLNSAEGLYYYYHLFARTLRAHGENTVVDARGRVHDWRSELAARLAAAQRSDGSWLNTGSPRWLEDRPELVTAYAVLALQETGQ